MCLVRGGEAWWSEQELGQRSMHSVRQRTLRRG
jgi:hypothetical protein